MNLLPFSSTNSLLPHMKYTALLAAALCHTALFAASNTVSWPTTPLSIKDAVEVALRQNSAVLKSQADLEAVYGVVVQTRAIQLPRVTGSINHSLNILCSNFLTFYCNDSM